MGMREQDPKSKFALGSEVLQKLFENGNSPLSEQFMRWKLWARWSEFVGPTVAANTEPVGYHRGTLFLWVRNSTWMQQLSFMRDHIQDSINKKMGRPFVKKISYTLDRREVPAGSNQEDFKNVIAKIVPEDDNR